MYECHFCHALHETIGKALACCDHYLDGDGGVA